MGLENIEDPSAELNDVFRLCSRLVGPGQNLYFKMSVIFGGPTVPLDPLVQLRESVKGSIPENVYNTQATKAFSDEDFMSLLMDNSTDPQASFCVDLMFPTAKGVYEHYPRSLKCTLSYMPQELRQSAVGYLMFNAVQAKRKSTLSDASQVKLEYPPSRTRLIIWTHIFVLSTKSYRSSLSFQ